KMRLDLLTESGVRTDLGIFDANTDELFSFVSRDNPQTSRSYIATSGIALFNPAAPVDGTPQKADIEDWVISPAYLADDVNLGANYAEAIKGYGNPRITEFTH